MVHKVLQEGHPVVRDESLYVLDQMPMYVFIGRPSKKHKVKRGGLKRAHELSVTMAAKVPLFHVIDSTPTNSHRLRSSYPCICTISVGQASISPTQA